LQIAAGWADICLHQHDRATYEEFFMEQPHRSETPSIRANVDQLLQELQQLVKSATPTDPQQACSKSTNSSGAVLTDQ